MRTYQELTCALFCKEGETAQSVALPHTWNAFDGQDGGADYHRGTGFYQIQLPDPTLGMRQYIEFQGANHIAKVSCNGTYLGEHRGGFSTFRFDLTDVLKTTNNTLSVEVFNGVCPVYPQRADFTFYGGLYRTVAFIEAETAHFDLLKDGTAGIFVTPRTTGGVRVDLFPVNCEGCTVAVEIKDAEGNVVASGMAAAAAQTTIQLQVEKPHLWHGVEDPYCYGAEAVLLQGEKELDRVKTTFGYRSFHCEPNTGFWLNGKNVPLRGVCRHQDRQDKGWAISKADHEEDARIIHEIGANTIRLAHYQHDQYFYDLCDKLGFVLWAEIPLISKFMEGQEAYENTISQMRELVAQNYNHPSICFWGISNEITIGGFCEEQLRNLHDLHALCKKMDPNRLTTMAHLGNVPMDSEHIQITDVQSFNYYLGWYSSTVDQNGVRMDTFHATHPDKVYGISEYGADNYTCWHSAKPFNHDYTEEYAVWYHQEMLKTFAARPYLWATHMWNMFDFAADARDEGGFKGINAKGLVTYDRKIRKDSFYLYQAYWAKKPMVHICGSRFVDRAPEERNIIVVTNEDAVTLEVNGTAFATQKAQDHMVTFENVPFVDGENTLTAKTAQATDTAILNGVAEHNSAYDLPDIMAAVNAGDWFQEKTEEGKAENYYTVHAPGNVVFTNPECLRLVQGWLMTCDTMTLAEKMTLISRLPNYAAMWGERSLAEIPVVKRLVTAESLDRIDRMLRRVKKP